MIWLNFVNIISFGESHGKYIGCLIIGLNSNILISKKNILIEILRRSSINNKYSTNRKETDNIKIISGIFNGKTTGAIICILIKNKNFISNDYKNLYNIIRPNHIDYVYWHKYKNYDYRGSGIASGRITANIISSNTIIKTILFNKFKINIIACLSQIGFIKILFNKWNIVNKNIFYISNLYYFSKIKKYLFNLKKNNNSCGCKIKLIIKNLPINLGNYYNKFNSLITYYLININSIKSIKIGNNKMIGSDFNDQINLNNFISNNSGGILGGITNNQNIIIKLILKPTSSIRLPQYSINKLNKIIITYIKGRHDPCIGIRIIPIIESILYLIIYNFILINKIKL